LLTGVSARQAAAAAGVGTCWPWETAATLPSAQGASSPTGGGEGRGHIVVAARLQLVHLAWTYATLILMLLWVSGVQDSEKYLSEKGENFKQAL